MFNINDKIKNNLISFISIIHLILTSFKKSYNITYVNLFQAPRSQLCYIRIEVLNYLNKIYSVLIIYGVNPF